MSRTNILDEIVSVKTREIEVSKLSVPIEQLRDQLLTAPPVRDFHAPLAAEGPIKLIAEVKKASPSKGVIREDFDPVQIAQCYAQHGATCLSVLTDEKFFQGNLRYLNDIRQAVELPILRKDFVLDTYQVLEARVAGADAVLLIAECLEDSQLQILHDEIVALGMTPLVEFYQEQNLQRVLNTGAVLVGVNNRNLQTFETDLNHVMQMRTRIPSRCLVVGESGIHSRDDVNRLAAAGVNAMLVGEHLMAAEQMGPAVEALLNSDTA